MFVCDVFADLGGLGASRMPLGAIFGAGAKKDGKTLFEAVPL